METQLTKPVPAAPNKFSRIWTLYYRYGAVPYLHKNFNCDGSMLDAINRARQHCIVMGYKFICVRPFLIDLDEQERRREEGEKD